MKNCLFTLISALVFISCSTTKVVPEKRCKSIFEGSYQNILEENFISVVDKDTIVLNEVKYECAFSAMYTKKGMYDRFGKWDKEIIVRGSNHPILLWKHVKLFPNDTTEFLVAANGRENVETIYASVLVFDKQNNDLLSASSEYRTKLIEYFSEMIKSNNTKKRDFYEIYWNTVDPEYWAKLKQYRKERQSMENYFETIR